MSGWPGSGKSLAAECLAREYDAAIVSIDEIWRTRGGSHSEQYARAEELVKDHKGSVLVDSCALSRRYRKRIASWAEGRQVIIAWMTTPLSVCRKRKPRIQTWARMEKVYAQPTRDECDELIEIDGGCV
jgi:adenylate kinase family enzyme